MRGCSFVRNVLGRIDDTLAPRRCVFCGTPSRPQENGVCVDCRADLPWIETACPRCAQPSAAPLPDGVICADCQQRPPPLERCIAPLNYAFPIDAAVKAFKFRRRLDYGPAFAELLRPSFGLLADDIDALLPVPLHWMRQAKRGFNQASEICRPLSKASRLPLVTSVCRAHATRFQSGLPAAERQANLQGAFRVRSALRYRHVLIVDDVITTGATVHRLAGLLLGAGAERVSALALARARRD